MRERFVSEALKPVTATCDTSRMAVGEPGLPLEFSWHDETIRISEVLRTWRETGKCRHGSGEDYVRKHWFEVRTASTEILRIYFERQSRGGPKGPRWWLFSILETGSKGVRPGQFTITDRTPALTVAMPNQPSDVSPLRHPL